MPESFSFRRSRASHHSVTTRIIIWYCFLVILPFLAFAGILFTYYRNHALKEVRQEAAQMMSVTASSLKREMQKNENDSDIFYLNGLVNQIPSGGNLTQDLSEQLENELGALCNMNSALHGAYLVIGQTTLHGGGNYPEVLLEMQDHQKEIADAEGACLWYPSETAHGKAGEYRFILARSLNSSTAENVGMLYLIFSNQSIKELFSEMQGGTSQHFLTDAEGTILYSSDPDQTGSKTDISMIPKDTQDYSAEIRPEEGSPYLLLSSQIYGLQWFCVTRIDLKSFNGGIAARIFPFAGLALICLVFLSVMMRVLQRDIFRPLRTLKRAMDQYAQGGLKATDLKPFGDGEFRSLSRHFNLMTKRIETLMKAYKKEEQEKNRQRLKTLSAQLTPHFIYNALNTIKWVAVLNHQEQIQHLTESLVMIFMNAARSDDENYTLSDELKLVQSYAVIQKARFMNFDLVIDDGNVQDASKIQFRKLLLQPVVENAIVHGLGRGRVKDGRIDIRMYTNDQLHIEVIDNGCGFDVAEQKRQPEKRESHTGIGLKNVEQIIHLEFGKAYGMHIDSAPGKGTKVSYILPILPVKEQKDDSIVR